MSLSIVTWKWKPKTAYRSNFGPETVNILKQCIKRNYKKPHKFICVTDDATGLDSDIKVIPLWNDFSDLQNPFGASNPSCYRRLKMFGPEAKGLFGDRFVSLDLDTVITGDLESLWDRPEDIVLYGDTNPGTYYNGSMMLMTAGCRPQVWDDFHPLRSPILAKAAGQFGSDQAWISYSLGPSEAKWTLADGVYSFRIHIRNRRHSALPEGAKIVMFHGGIDPWSPQALTLEWVKKFWRYDLAPKDDGIASINIDRRLAFLPTGHHIPIIKLFDVAGQETDDTKAAVAFVAGLEGRFWSGVISHFHKVKAC